jgi:GMP synthase (glutamine-hydrolysing)
MIKSRRSAMALRHVAFEDLGLLAPIMDRHGWDVSFCEAAVDDLAHGSIRNADLIVVLGGPIGVYEIDAYPFLTEEIALLEHRLSRHLPTLGICLGSQLMAKALGSRVFKGPVKEIGWGAVELTEQGASSCLDALRDDDAVVLHWHGDSFDLPAGASRLASNRNYENRAAGISVPDLRAQTLKHERRLALRAERIFGQWLQQIDPTNDASLPNASA